MTEEPQGTIINVKKIPGAILLCMVVIVAVFSISGTSFGLLQSQADALYCSKVSNVLCPPACNTGAVMIVTGTDNCNGASDPNGIGYCPNGVTLGFVPDNQCGSSSFAASYIFSDNSTKRTLSSSTFTTYTHADASLATPVGFPIGNPIYCRADAQVQSSNVLAVVDFRIRDTINGEGGSTWRVNTLVANDNFTISYAASTGFTSKPNGVYALQFSITGVGSIIIYHAQVECMIPNSVQSAIVG